VHTRLLGRDVRVSPRSLPPIHQILHKGEKLQAFHSGVPRRLSQAGGGAGKTGVQHVQADRKGENQGRTQDADESPAGEGVEVVAVMDSVGSWR